MVPSTNERITYARFPNMASSSGDDYWSASQSSCLELQNVGPCTQLVQIVGPALHHFAPGWQVGCSVVGPAVGILHCVGKLMLDQVNPFAQHLIQDRADSGPEAVGRLHLAAVPHAPQGRIDRVFGHATLTSAQAWEDKAPMPSDRVQLSQDL